MALVITNGEYYAMPNRNGGVNKTNDITEAQVFSNVNTAAEKLKKHKGYLKGYYVWDTEGETMQTKRIRIKRIFIISSKVEPLSPRVFHVPIFSPL